MKARIREASGHLKWAFAAARIVLSQQNGTLSDAALATDPGDRALPSTGKTANLANLAFFATKLPPSPALNGIFTE